VIDFFASAYWYVEHMAPIWLALPPETRGRFYVSHAAARSARGLPGVLIGRPRGDDVPMFVASYGDYRVATMVGRSSIALGQHGAGQSYSSQHTAYPGGRGQDRVSLFLLPNEHSAARTRKAYPSAQVEVVGCPKLDTLPTKARDGEPVIAFSFHWDGQSIAPEMHSAWRAYYAALPELARRHRIIGHAHPRTMAQFGRVYRQSGIEVVPTFGEVLRKADVYACDNSSSLFEFAATGRPVLVLNTPDYRRTVEHGLRFWAASGVGINVEHPRELEAAILRAIDDPPEVAAAREAALDIVYQPRTGGAALAAGILADWAAQHVVILDIYARRKARTQIQNFRAAHRHLTRVG